MRRCLRSWGKSQGPGLLQRAGSRGNKTPGDLLSAPQAAPAALQVLDDSDDLRHDAELLLLLPPRE